MEISKNYKQGEDDWHPLRLEMQTHCCPGKFIVFEGIDGSGKTSLITALSEYLDNRGEPNVITKTPTDNIRGMWAWRACFDGSVDIGDIHQYGVSIMAFGDRLVHQQQVVEPALRSRKWVLCDRYILSSVAYQSSIVHELLARLLIRPDLGILVDVDPEEALRRIRERDYEDENLLGANTKATIKDITNLRIRNRFRVLAPVNDFITVDTTGSTVEKSFEQIKERIDTILYQP